MSIDETGASPTTRAASWLVVTFGVLVALNALVAWVTTGVTTGADISFVIMLLMAVSVCGIGLRRLASWAWWISLLLAAVGLFFVLPVTGTILLGGPSDPVGTGWDVVFFPLTTLVLLALVAALLRTRREVTGSP